ncbi:hypothetical protein MKW98_018510 [Papaver atlanticum]|uniref:Transglycosylase SLT domain-containing protein n=1 Tax=Papaver atlanticum TaxID=357466 RepID=A0AAD4TGP6_9MAGN|nr:hypothetical protein MKW98_018510 [Papaver atlanticum]
MEEMWNDPEVSKEWIDAGEMKGQKVHLSRDPDGQAFLTQTEMKVVAGIVARRHFLSQIDPDMICAISELESDRQPLAMRHNKKTKDITVGIMQVLPKTAEWLVRENGYQTYQIEGNLELLHKPFINVYFGAAYLKWLSSYDGFKNDYGIWQTFVITKTTALSALAEVNGKRFVDGIGSHTGIMGIDYEKAVWLHRELGYKAYKIDSVEDLLNPFASMYFAAAYLVWLNKYEGRERSPQFVIQAYLGGPENVKLQETGPLWLKFEQALSYYEDPKFLREQGGSCIIL